MSIDVIVALTWFSDADAYSILEASCHARDGLITAEEFLTKIERVIGHITTNEEAFGTAAE